MKTYTYNFEVSTLLAQFLDAFNEVVIKRWDRSVSHSNPTQRGPDIKPTIRYSPKQRVIDDYVNNQAVMRLPVIAFNITGLSRDQNRVFNKLTGPQYNKASSDSRYGIKQPVPVDLKIQMNIMSKFQEDLDQILTNFIPYTDDYVTVSWPSPYLTDQEIRTTVHWDGSMNLEYPTDTTYKDHFRIIGTTTFTVKGWLFKAESDQPIKLIHNIYNHFHAVSGFYCDYSSIENLRNDLTTETMIISGRPVLSDISPTFIFPCKETTMTVTGDMFDFTTDYFLSGSNIEDSSFYDFSGTSYEPYIQGLSGLQINPTILSPNVLQFTTPAISSIGSFDIIAINDAGISFLSKECLDKSNSFFPHPCINGVEVVNNYTYC
jgi:hypothetical protein